MRKYKNQRKCIDKNQTKSKICKSNFSPKLHGVEVKHTKYQQREKPIFLNKKYRWYLPEHESDIKSEKNCDEINKTTAIKKRRNNNNNN
jgi:hypothetical protein